MAQTNPDPPIPAPDDGEEAEFAEPDGIDDAQVRPFSSVDGLMADEPADPAFEAVIEAGGGVAEGFEQSETLLVESASDDDPDTLDRVAGDAGEPEDADRDAYGEADEEHTSEGRD